MALDEAVLKTFDDSLRRCNANPVFLDRFYEIFLASSNLVREKFANTDFNKQKEALRLSLDAMLLAAKDEVNGPDTHLRDLAEMHSSRKLNIGAGLYDDWLDSLLAAVKECDPQYSAAVHDAWEHVMTVGIRYLLSRY
jgi:hypothetical protein